MNRLNIIDKHRQRLVIVHTLNLGETYRDWSSEDDLKPEFYLNRVASREDGTPVGWFDFHGRTPPESFYPNKALHVVVNEEELPHMAGRGVQDNLPGHDFHIKHMVDTKFRPLFPDGSATTRPRCRPMPGTGHVELTHLKRRASSL